jgi:hypothetical protein
MDVLSHVVDTMSHISLARTSCPSFRCAALHLGYFTPTVWPAQPRRAEPVRATAESCLARTESITIRWQERGTHTRAPARCPRG